MRLDESSMKPIYVQIADAIEDEIIAGRLEEGAPCYSQVVVSKELGVNPATAGKGINYLVTRGVLIKQRGQAMMVVEGAKEQIIRRKTKEELGSIIKELITMAKQLNVSVDEIIEDVRSGYEEA